MGATLRPMSYDPKIHVLHPHTHDDSVHVSIIPLHDNVGPDPDLYCTRPEQCRTTLRSMSWSARPMPCGASIHVVPPLDPCHKTTVRHCFSHLQDGWNPEQPCFWPFSVILRPKPAKGRGADNMKTDGGRRAGLWTGFSRLAGFTGIAFQAGCGLTVVPRHVVRSERAPFDGAAVRGTFCVRVSPGGDAAACLMWTRRGELPTPRGDVAPECSRLACRRRGN